MDILGTIMNEYGLYAGLFITLLTYIYYFNSRKTSSPKNKSKGSRLSSFIMKAFSLLAFLWLVLVIIGIFYEIT